MQVQIKNIELIKRNVDLTINDIYIIQSFRKYIPYNVYGILFKEKINLIFLNVSEGRPFLTFFNSIFFDFVGNYVPYGWIGAPIIHEMNEFNGGFYFGIDKFLTEPLFYRNYTEYENEDCVSYINNEIRIIDEQFDEHYLKQ